MTLRLYYDSDDLSFDAIAIAHDGDPCRVILDRTAFYPTSGGQPHDIGVLGDARVIDVIDADERIIHVVDVPIPLGPVQGEVDPARRRDFTVQHTAQHLVSALAAEQLGWNTESVHFGATHSTIEFDAAAAGEEQLRSLEEWSSIAIGSALKVSAGTEEAAARGLRKPTGRTGPIRVVTIDGLDRSACGGTHVTSTAQLGSIFITGVERIRGRIRVGYLAGERVLSRLRECEGLLGDLAAVTGAGVDDLQQLIPARLDALRLAEKRIEALERDLGEYRMRELLADAETVARGNRRIVLDRRGASVDELLRIARAVQSGSHLCLVAASASPATVLLAASPDSGVDCGALLKEALAAVNGRGGGSRGMARGTVGETAELQVVIHALLEATR